MIRSIHLQNFECHKDTKLEFSEGLNIISGRSGYGKSSIIRAINWVLFNVPSGDSMVPHEDKKGTTKVTVEFSDGSRITRIKSKSSNEYVVHINGANHKFKALRGKVPELVTTVSNMNNCNIQLQKDFYFLLNDSPGQVAKKLNEVVGLDEMDRALSEINSRTRKFTWELGQLQEKSKYLSSQIKELEWAYQADKDLLEIEELQDGCSEYKSDIAAIESTIAEIAKLKTKLEEFTDPIVLEDINGIDELVEDMADVEADYEEIQNAIRAIKSLIEKKKGISLPTEDSLSELSVLYNEIQDATANIERLDTLLDAIVVLEEDRDKARMEVEAAKVEYDAILKECKVCPTCNQPIN